MYSTKKIESQHTCLACGRELYGRTDKKFCGKQCRNAYHNNFNTCRRKEKEGIVNSLYKNYLILEQVIKSQKDSVEICDLESLGYKSAFVTGFHLSRNRTAECRCFDISFRQCGTKLTRIRKNETLSSLLGGFSLLNIDDD